VVGGYVFLWCIVRAKARVGLKKYRVEIFMIKPYDFVDRWPKRPDENDALEAFTHELLTLDADEHFKIEVSEV
jgi:hypothetical protein